MVLKKCFNHAFLKSKRKYRDLLCWTILLTFTFLCGCGPGKLERSLTGPAQFQSLDNNLPFLKAHLHDGRVYILSPWKVDSENQTVTGQGEILNINRETLQKGQFTIPIDSVALFETDSQIHPSIDIKALLSAAALAISVVFGIIGLLPWNSLGD